MTAIVESPYRQRNSRRWTVRGTQRRWCWAGSLTLWLGPSLSLNTVRNDYTASLSKSEDGNECLQEHGTSSWANSEAWYLPFQEHVVSSHNCRWHSVTQTVTVSVFTRQHGMPWTTFMSWRPICLHVPPVFLRWWHESHSTLAALMQPRQVWAESGYQHQDRPTHQLFGGHLSHSLYKTVWYPQTTQQEQSPTRTWNWQESLPASRFSPTPLM